MSVQRTGVKALHWTCLIVGAIVLVGPLLYMVSASLMTAPDVNAYPPKLLPSSLDWQNYSRAYDFLTARTVVNSFIFSIGVVVFQLALGLPAGFALAKIPFRGAAFLLGMVVVPMFLPQDVSLIPLYVVTHELGLVNSYAGMIVPIAGSTAFATLLFRQFIVNMPADLIDAARIDGAGWGRILVSVILPLCMPAVAAFSSVTFLAAWQMYIWPLIVAPDPDLRVMPVALAPLAQGGYEDLVPPNVTMAAAVISTLPVLAVFLIAQRWYVRGLVGAGLGPS